MSSIIGEFKIEIITTYLSDKQNIHISKNKEKHFGKYYKKVYHGEHWKVESLDDITYIIYFIDSKDTIIKSIPELLFILDFFDKYNYDIVSYGKISYISSVPIITNNTSVGIIQLKKEQIGFSVIHTYLDNYNIAQQNIYN